MKLARYLGLALVLILLAGVSLPYVDAEGYRERIQNALEQALNRKVTAGKVRFNLLTGPGFTVEDVTIGEDPSIGIEPIAYVPSLSARVRLTTLFTSRLSFSNLRLSQPTVNLAKSDSGVWNFQLLLRDASARAAASPRFPSIQVRTGRINFKFGDYKTIFYLTDSDLDVTPLSAERLDVRFSGQPARTDQAAQNFGRLLGRGIWTRANRRVAIDANVELERSGISDLARLMGGHDIGVHGTLASRAHIAGPIGNLKIIGQLRLEDIHRWDLLPPKSGGWDLKYQGTADLGAQRIDLQTDREQNSGILQVHFRASDYLSEPKWAAMLELKEAPVSGFLEVARHMGASLPEGFAADGKVAGLIGYSRPGGVQGQFEIHNSSVRLQQAPPLDIRSAQFILDGDKVHIGPGTVALGDGQTADVQGSYDGASGAVSVEVNTAAMDPAELHSGSGRLLGAGAIPILEACKQGSWRGSLRYIREKGESAWSGSFELRGARMDVAGLSEPVRIVSAKVDVDGPKFSLSLIKARAGTVLFTGEYHHDRAGRVDRARLDIAEADLAVFERLFLPSLRRDAGFLARFRLRAPPAPEWLQTRHVDATVRIQKFTVGDQAWSASKLRAIWDGTAVRIGGIEARDGDAQASGQIVIDLSSDLPRYRIEGKIDDFDYRGGTLNIEGSGQTKGTGDELVANARAAGTFTGGDLTLSPDVEFGSISGSFDLTPGGRVRLTGVQAAQGLDSYSGQGATQPDGKVMLELTSGKRQVRVAVAR